MSGWIAPFAEYCAGAIEALGIALIVLISFFALFRAALNLLRRLPSETIFTEFRQQLGRGILLGLELLIAADIIHTVAVDLTLESIGILAAVVAIRTFLSFTLEVELTGRWPWQSESGQNKR
ncbi:MAG: DUF1622 domain-containing protein [Alcanivoracaceae bacterium]|jgi:uncharacterized membrane protein|nr:DUF1622 domain-containing protein [Alcanivoracaceae bacterium]